MSDPPPGRSQYGNDSGKISIGLTAPCERMKVQPAAFAGGPVALAYSRFDATTREEAHAEYLESISGFRSGDGQYDIPGEFVAVSGKKE